MAKDFMPWVTVFGFLGVVLVLGAVLKRIFEPSATSKGKVAPDDLAEARTKAVEIVKAYGKVLENQPATYRSVSELPYSKKHISDAFKLCMLTEPDPQVNGALKAGYLALADFQELSGEEAKAVKEWDILTDDPSTVDRASLSKTLSILESLNARKAAENERRAAFIENLAGVTT